MSYAGFQRYDVPDIGSNVAKILLEKQQQASANNARQQAIDMQNRKLQESIDKENKKISKGYEKDIDIANTTINKELSEVPKTGYETVDGFGSALATLAKTESNAMASDLRKTGDYSIFNLKKQSLQSGIKDYKASYDALAKTTAIVNENPDASPVTKALLKDALELFTPTQGGAVAPTGEWQPNGEWKPMVVTYGNENGESKVTSKHPISTLNTLAQLDKYKARDFEKEIATSAGRVGGIIKELKTGGGGTKTVKDELNQKNFIAERTQWINSVVNNGLPSAEAYMKYVTEPGKNPVPLLKGSSDLRKEQLAQQYGYSSTENVNWLEYELKNGSAVFDMKPEQKKELTDALTMAYNNKADYSESINLPHTTNISANIFTPNKEVQTRPTMAQLSVNPEKNKDAYDYTVFELNEGLRTNRIGAWEFEKTPTRMISNEIGLPSPIGGELTGNITIYTKTADGGIDFTNPIVINAEKDFDKFQRLLGPISGASNIRSEHYATEPALIKQ